MNNQAHYLVIQLSMLAAKLCAFRYWFFAVFLKKIIKNDFNLPYSEILPSKFYGTSLSEISFQNKKYIGLGIIAFRYLFGHYCKHFRYFLGTILARGCKRRGSFSDLVVVKIDQCNR